MGIFQKKAFLFAGILLAGVFLASCGPESASQRAGGLSKAQIQPGETIGSLAEVFVFEPIPVSGYGIVAGLAGTGSGQCPPQVREYLKRYILIRAPGINADEFIDRSDTAVVSLSGLIPAGASKGQRFDVGVAALSGTQTTSLSGGQLYTAEMSPYGTLSSTRVLARAQGPVFIDIMDQARPDEKSGYVLGGGVVQDDFRIGLALFKPDYPTSNAIRNRINERFSGETAKPTSAGLIYLEPPRLYQNQKDKFISLVKAMYVIDSPELNRQRVNTLIRQLAVSAEKDAAEWGLEVIGQTSLEKLGALLNSAQEVVRLRAARCMLNLGDDRGLEALRRIVAGGQSEHRVTAIEAVARSAKRNDALAIIRKALPDIDFEVRLAGYEALLGLDDISISRQVVANSFFVDMVQQDGSKTIFVSRRGTPKVVLFGAPIYAEKGFFLESEDGQIILDARSEGEQVTVIRKHSRYGSLMSVRSGLELTDIIRALGEEPVGEAGRAQRGGLAVPYSDIAAILQKMCQKGAINAEFYAGDLPKIK